MTYGAFVSRGAVQMNQLMRASPPMLLLATAMAVLTLCQLLNRAEAGGKGKGGRQGHIIIQNEVKGNPVPVYVPIPIPIPMPVGGPSQGHNHHHNHHQQQRHNNGDGEGEVRKIYLLQPMGPVARPQPHLKGGGFMGAPVQNNIHLGPGVGHHQLSMSPGKHRHAGVKTTLTFDALDQHQQHAQPLQHQQQQFQQFQQFQLQQQQQQQQQEPEHKHVKSSSAASEVKILPIVVIPPMAPMPPIQVPQQVATSQVPRMTLTPQFNNYVLAAGAGSHDRRRSVGNARGGGHGHGPGHHTGHHHHHHQRQGGQESFAEYGGSLGGSVFRERYAGRSRPVRSRSLRVSLPQHPGEGAASEFSSGGGGGGRQRSDFDYGDYDQPRGEPVQREDEFAMQRQRSQRWRRGDSAAAAAAQQRAARQERIKSIRDIIEQAEQEDAAAAASSTSSGDDFLPTGDSAPRYSRGGGGGGQFLDETAAVGGVADLLTSGRARASAAMEISMDELSNLLPVGGETAGSRAAVERGGVGSASSQHELSSLYYDRGTDPPAAAPTVSDSYRSSSSSASRPSRNFRLPRPDERDLFDSDDATSSSSSGGDQWRFDTLKSVRHVAPPPPLANTTAATPTNGTLSASGPAAPTPGRGRVKSASV